LDHALADPVVEQTFSDLFAPHHVFFQSIPVLAVATDLHRMNGLTWYKENKQ
jgi:hypothetical protein